MAVRNMKAKAVYTRRVPHRGRRDAAAATCATETQTPRSGDERSLNAARLSWA